MPQSNPAIAFPATNPATKPTPGLTRVQRRIIADVLTWDTQREISPEDIEAIALQHDVLWVRLVGNRAIPIAVETFKTIRKQQLEEQARRAAEVDIAHVLNFCQNCFEQQETVQPQDDPQDDIEIDRDESHTPTYRVWKGWHFLGTFHQSPVDEKWLSSPAYGRDYRRYAQPDEAQQAIIAAWKRAETVRKNEVNSLVHGVSQHDN